MLREIALQAQMQDPSFVRLLNVVADADPAANPNYILVLELVDMDMYTLFFNIPALTSPLTLSPLPFPPVAADPAALPALTASRRLRNFKRLLWDTLRGVAAMKRYGIVHRDLKLKNIGARVYQGGVAAPANVLPDLEAKVLDFGLARALEVDQQGTLTGTVVSSGYRAPEIMLLDGLQLWGGVRPQATPILDGVRLFGSGPR